MKKKLAGIGLLIPLFSGCLGMGLQNMTKEQIQATEGMATCSSVNTTYGSGITVTVNVDDVRKGATNKSKTTITPRCEIIIETDTGVANPVIVVPKEISK